MATKKTSEKIPYDIKGEMIYLGSIVALPIVEEDANGKQMLTLQLGVVSKLTQKRGMDVTTLLYTEGEDIHYPDTDKPSAKKRLYNKTRTMRITAPFHELCVVPKESLKTRDDYHEALRMYAAKL